MFYYINILVFVVTAFHVQRHFCKLTFERSSIAEHIKLPNLLLASIGSEARPIVGATTRMSGFGDRILHCTVT